jgi:hypothetical protein
LPAEIAALVVAAAMREAGLKPNSKRVEERDLWPQLRRDDEPS